MTSPSEVKDIDDEVPVDWQVCEGCRSEFVPISNAVLCGECLHELFEKAPRTKERQNDKQT